ncbi:MAG: Eco57I restriction-modification methylase domain-containing protein, partial [Anaerolineae bacterium]
GNAVQGDFNVVSLRLRNGELLQMACGVADAPAEMAPEMIDAATVDRILEGQHAALASRVRTAMAQDPRFITLYYRNKEYGCLREFFPPMSPDVLDAALALILDALFDQLPIQRITELPEDTEKRDKSSGIVPAKTLFSSDYLDATLPHTVAWEDDARVAFETARSLWHRASARGDDWDTAQTERSFVQPLLRALGWAAVRVPDQPSPVEGTYALCSDDVACAELYMEYEEGDPMSPWVLAMVQAAPWARPLDQPLEQDRPPRASGATPRGSEVSVPSHRLVSEMKRTGVRWGMLTNGRVWRLFSRDANSLSRSFYEVDLAEVFDQLDIGDRPGPEHWERFKQWWLLFRRASYVIDQRGRCLLEQLRDRSPQEAGKVHELLRNRLVNVALPAIAGGFVAYRRQRSGVAEETPVSLRDIYRASVKLLLRLVFLLATDARGLLPVDDGSYDPHSLTAQARWAVERVRNDLPLSEAVYTTPRYDLLLTLLHRVSRGDAAKSIPRYGSLFFSPVDDPDHAFIEHYRLSDRALALALDALLRDIDYTALDARDLGRICSALLDQQLQVVDAETGEVEVRPRESGAANSRAHLPDYVVTSSVQGALAPILEARYEAFEAAMQRVVALRRKLQHALDRQKRAALYARWEAAAREARQAFFGIRVCDPAMGAGDFLISAVDVLTDGIIERLQAYHDQHPRVPREWNPVYKLIGEVREDILAETGRQGVDVDIRKLDEATVLSRLVAQRCVFGVARDPLAVELATVGLWLHTFTVGAPFSLLSHHLRAGDALLGVDLADVTSALGTDKLLSEVLDAVSMLYAVTERVDATPLDVRWSASQFGRVEDRLAPHRGLLNLWLTASLGDADAQEIWDRIASAPSQGDSADREGVADLIPTWVEMQAEAEGFFHWELAFPEIFADLTNRAWVESPGFDAVVGSPPWTVPADDRLSDYYEARFGEDAADFDVHQAFLTLAWRLTRPTRGRTAFVVTRQWLADPMGSI